MHLAHWSIAQTKNRETEASGIGWELFLNYRIARDKYKPDYFLYENNKSMSPAIRTQITAELGVEPVLINSALLSAQNRQRLYWVGKRNQDGTYSQVAVEQPEDRGIMLRDILETGFPLREKSYALQTGHSATAEDAIARRQRNAVAEPVVVKPLTEKEMEYMVRDSKGKYSDRWSYLQKPGQSDKALCLTANISKGVPYNVLAGPVAPPMQVNEATKHCGTIDAPIYQVRDGMIVVKGEEYPIKLRDGFYSIRKLTVRECMRLQTVPEEYVFPVSYSQAYKMLGNGWTVDVIAHIMSHFTGLTKEPVEVLSMYDGMSCGHIALDKLGAEITTYYATEIDKYAIQTTQRNYPDTIQLGDAFQVRNDDWRVGE